MKKNFQFTLLFAALFASVSAWPQSSNFSYGFEAAPGANDWSANIGVASGTNGITPASGGFYGLVPNSPPVFQFTRFGSYSSVFSCNGYKTSIKIYLDVSLGHANDTRATYSVAASNTSGTHRRDFVFSIGFYNDGVAPGTGNRFVVSASNNSPGWPRDPGRNPTVVATTSGWYTFEHSFENNAGVLQVVMKVYDASNTVVGTWTLSDPSDLIPSVVGGNRYGWVTLNQFSFLAIDDVSLSINPVAGPVHNTNTLLNYCSIQAAIDDPLTLNGHTIVVDAGTYTENINLNKSVTINGPNAGIAGTGGRGAEAILLNCYIDINNVGTMILDGLHIKRTDGVLGAYPLAPSDQILLDGAGTNTVQNCVIERLGSVTGTVIRALTTTAGGGTKNILNNKITGDASGGLFSNHKSWNNAIYINGGTAAVNVSGNTIMNSRTALSIDDYTINVLASGNTLNNNGTHIGLGGTLPASGQFVMGANDFINNTASTMVNCSNVNVNFRLDITSSTLGGVAFAALTNAQLFDVEARMAHKTTGSKKGKVTYVANTQYVNNFSVPFVKIDQIQNSVLYAEVGNIINLQAGTYPQRVVIDKSVTLQGVESTKTLYILDGTGLAPNGSGAGSQSGIVVNSGIINTTIKDLTIQNFTGVSGNNDGAIYGILSNNNLTITNVALLNNPTAAGFYANGPVDNVSITNSTVTNNGGGARGMVIWNGLKTNITFSNNMLTNNSCCGIELQDGNASGVNVTGNTIDIGGGDNAIGLVGLNNSVGANTINSNIITGGGRFGIEIKNPAAGVTVNGNTVTLSTQNGDVRDRAGIAILRRSVTAGNVDVPNGVSITGNTVIGYQQVSTSEGFGIVVEGTNHTVTGNTVTGCDVGILQQQNPSNYPGDADQSNLADLYFGRGNSPMTCGNIISGNTLSNTINTRNIGVGGGIVTNTTSLETFCSIQAAINDAQTLDGHTIVVGPGTYPEAVTINKSIQLKGQPGQVLATIIQAPATLPLPATQNSNIITITGAGISAEINELTIAGPGPSGCGSISFGIFVRNGAYANIHDNRIIDVRDNPFSGCQNGVGIQVGRNAWGTAGTATITNNIITGYQKNGITIDNTGSSATITGNTITGAGTTAIIAQNGIQISRGATGSLTGNTVSGNSFHLIGNPSDWGSTGILLYQSGAVSLNGGNNLSGNDQNYYAFSPTGAVTLGAEIFGSSSAPLGFGNQIVNSTTQNIDARSCTFGGLAPGAMSMAQLFNLEDFVYHSIDNPGVGFVYIKTNNNYVTINSFDAGGGYPDAQIQRGIDAASAGFTVNVQAGNYAKQIATNRSVFGVNGPHQFGLFVDKNNLTIRGYDVANVPVASASAAAVVFTTGATNNFGSSGIFVQSNAVTFEGLKVEDNYNNSNVRANNKTIEIIGDAFSMTKCWINPYLNEGAVYMGRWDIAHPISSYTLTQNKFENTLVSINNGAGLTGPRAGRLITNNEFVGVATPYLIGFRGWNGAGPVQGWIVDPVGGAVVTGNLFNTTGVDKYVVARGNAGGYINSELDWSEIWNMNTYGNHVVTLVDHPTFDVRSYVDGAGYPVTRRISPRIQENEVISQTGDVILVSAGTFDEDVNISKQVKLLGAGYPSTTVKGPIGGGTATMQVAAPGVIIDGFTITRAGNTVAEWNLALNTAGIAIQSNPNNAEVRNCKIFGNRTGIDINNSNGNNIHNNIIDNNRTGMVLRNQTNTTNVQQNFITNNWTLGVLFLDASGGSNTPPQQALTSTFNNNNISGNWYGDLQDRQSGGSLPAPGTNLKNFECNWYGAATAPIVTSANSSEPGYAAQIPVIFGGPAVAPGGQPNILGTASANIDFINWLVNGTDNSIPIIGFQPVPGSCSGSNILTITCPAGISVQCTSAVPPVNLSSVTTSGTCPGLVITHLGDVISSQTCANRYTITRTYQATDACSNTAICTQTITVNDNTSPTITCSPNITVSPTTLAGTVVTYSTPVVSDNCTGVGTPVRTAGPASGSTFPIGTTTVTYQVTDACGNTASCSFTVTVIDPYCDNKKRKAYVCHSGTTLCVSINDVQSHLNHGDYLGKCSGNSPVTATGGAANLKESVGLLPIDYKLSNYPNPFSLGTSILMELPEDSKLSLRVLDATGREVANLVKESRKAGTYTIDFNASGLGSGVYYAILEATANGKVIIKSVKIVKQ